MPENSGKIGIVYERAQALMEFYTDNKITADSPKLFRGYSDLTTVINAIYTKAEKYLRQLQQLGAFDKTASILLGPFTEMETKKCVPGVEALVKNIAGKDLPIAITKDIGHETDSKGIFIGQELCLEELL